MGSRIHSIKEFINRINKRLVGLNNLIDKEDEDSLWRVSASATIEFIQLNMLVVTSSLSFSEETSFMNEGEDKCLSDIHRSLLEIQTRVDEQALNITNYFMKECTVN